MNTENLKSQETEKKTNYKKIFQAIGCSTGIVLLAIIVLIIVFSRININIGKIEITKAVITAEIDKDGNPLPSNGVFPSSQPRIYCYILINSPKPIQVGVRWYYGDTLIFQDTEMINIWKAYYIQPQPGERFRVGEYHVEIYFIDKAIRTLSFSVIE